MSNELLEGLIPPFSLWNHLFSEADLQHTNACGDEIIGIDAKGPDT